RPALSEAFLVYRKVDSKVYRGSDASYLTPQPRSVRAAFPAYGLYGAFLVKGTRPSLSFFLSCILSFVRPAGFLPSRPQEIQSRRVQRRSRTGASSAPPEACP